MRRDLVLATLLASSPAFAASAWDSPAPLEEPASLARRSEAATPSAEKAPPDAPANHDLSPAINLAQSLLGSGTPAKGALAGAGNWAIGAAQIAGKQYLPTFELGLSFAENNKPVFGVLGVLPLFESKDLSNTVFSQLSSYRTDGRTTVNLGLGNRHLVADERVMLGVNVFYDHEFPYAHARTSVGGEIRTSVVEFNTNFYQAQSGWKSGRDGLAEKAMGGYDAELAVALPYMPLVKAYGRHFQWNATDGAANINGNALSLRASLMQGITIEAGRTFYSGGVQPNSNIIAVQVDFVRLFNPLPETRPFFASQAYAFESMREHRYDKVRRENIIQKQVGRGFIVTASGR